MTISHTLRPVPGTIMQQRGGPLVKVECVGMRWATVVDAVTGLGKHMVYLKDLLPVAPEAAATNNVVKTKPLKVGSRPEMAELDKEFIG